MVLDRLGDLLQLAHDHFHGLVDAALQLHRVVTGGHQLGALTVDGLGQHSGGGGAVTGHVGGLAGNFLHQLCAHVLELVLQLDLFGNGHAVLGDQGGAEGLLDDHVAAFGAQGYLDGVGQCVDTFEDGVAAFLVKADLFCGHALFLRNGKLLFVNAKFASKARRRRVKSGFAV